MMSKRRCLHCSLCVLGLLCAARGESRASAAPVRGNAKTPEEAVEAIVAAVKSSDFDAFLNHLGAHSKPSFELQRATFNLRSALDRKFGVDPSAGQRLSAADSLKQVVLPEQTIRLRAKVARSPALVALTIWKVSRDGEAEHIQEETWYGHRTFRGWKISLPAKGKIATALRKGSGGKQVAVRVLKAREFNEERSLRNAAFYNSLRKNVESVIKAVGDGKYKSHREAYAAVRKLNASLIDKE